MKCPECGHEMGKSSKCLRCGYVVKSVVAIDPEKIEQENSQRQSTERKEINPDDVRVSRSSGSIFDNIFGGSFFENIFGGSIFSSFFDGFGYDQEDTGYEYDPKYYDDFGNEIDLPDEFERDSVEISNVEVLEASSEGSDKQAENDRIKFKTEEPKTQGNQNTKTAETENRRHSFFKDHLRKTNHGNNKKRKK